MIHSLLKNLFGSASLLMTLTGILMTALGALVLLRNGLTPGQGFRWWALFILLPALALFGAAWLVARTQAPYQVTIILYGLGLVVLTVAAMFLLNLSWERWWPLMVITPTLPLFLLGLPDPALAQKPEIAAWFNLLAWVGGSSILLGLTFLAGSFHLIDLQGLANRVGWWSILILLVAAGAAWNMGTLWLTTGDFNLSAMLLGMITVTLLVTAFCEWFRLDWRIRTQALMIVTGVFLVLYPFLSAKMRALP
jgi:hypothetical protein